jgi:hypothetical protein
MPKQNLSSSSVTYSNFRAPLRTFANLPAKKFIGKNIKGLLRKIPIFIGKIRVFPCSS